MVVDEDLNNSQMSYNAKQVVNKEQKTLN